MAIYRDFAIDFLPDPQTGDLRFVEDDAAVAQSVRLLVQTAFYERPFQPSIGSAVPRILFEPLDAVTKAILAQTMNQVITQFEPRATVKQIDIYSGVDQFGRQMDPNEIVVTLTFLIYNRPNLVTTTVLLRRLR
jgi:phage baseplate assembly protein W